VGDLVRVLGLDLSVRASGLCFPDGSLSTFSPKRNDDWRLIEIRNYLVHVIRQWRIELVMIEGPFVSRNPSGAAALLGAHGVAKVAMLSNHTPYLTPAPSLVKLFATGKGNAPKLDVIKAAIHRLGIDPGDDNQADAAWLRAMGMDLAGHPLIPMPAAHRRALDNLRLPAALQPQET
jgi:Holliday junction resolvasome RuvABC endonuclease subunit